MHRNNSICGLVLISLVGSCFVLAQTGQRSPAHSVNIQKQPPIEREGLQFRSKELCFVSGVVLSGVSGEPVKRAQLSLRDADVNGAASRMETDATGRFLLQRVVQGHHRLIVRKKGFLDAEFDISSCEQQTDIASYSSVDNSPMVSLRLVSLSVISGRVIDQEGGPVVDASVQAKQYSYPGGPLRNVATATTDDLGMYRLHGLKPGSYYISADPAEPDWGGTERVSGDSTYGEYVTTFYPYTNDVRSATAVSLRSGEQTTGIEIKLVKLAAKGPSKVVPILFTESRALSSGTSTRPDKHSSQAELNPAEKGIVGGIVVNQLTSEPLRHAKVAMEGTRNGTNVSYVAETDATGIFSIRDVDPGGYHLMVDHPGFLQIPRISGVQSLMGASITVRRKQTLRDVVLQVPPSSVVIGRVFDRDGDPACDFQVQATRYSYIGGKHQLHLIATAVTNDLGEYRIHGLSPGTYYIAASTTSTATTAIEDKGQTPEHYVPTYYPRNTDLLSAAPVAVGQGDQISGIDIWATVSRPVTVSGRVLSSAGNQLGRNTVITLISRSIDAAGASLNSTTSIKDAQGHFEVRGASPGAYTLSALVDDKNEHYAGAQALEIRGTDIENIELVMNRAATVNGCIRVEGDKSLGLKSVRVLLEPDSNLLTGSVIGDVKPDGTFSIAGVLPDQYSIEVFGLPQEFYVRKIELGMEDIQGRKVDFRHTAGSLELVVSPSGGSITGSVVDEEQNTARGVEVVLVPAVEHRQERDLYRTALSNKEGQFNLVGIAPGEYKLFALPEVEPEAYFDPNFIGPLEDYGQVINVEENSSHVALLQVLPTP
jgi:protocatechuate 3,4-dioxygenase beta subunit